MKFAVFSTLFAAAFATPLTVVDTAAGPDPKQISITGITYGGTGCPQGTVSQQLNADKTAFTLLFDQYIAQMGPGLGFSGARKNCQINVALRIPQGWQYSVATVDYRGFMNLQAGVNAKQTASYYFQGSLATCRKETNFYGPAQRDYTLRDSFDVNTLVWSDCGAKANVNINSALFVTGPSGRSGIITTDSIDGKVKQIYGLSWRRC
jgi:hypothetical protein